MSDKPETDGDRPAPAPFRAVTAAFWAAPQIAPGDLAEAKAAGVSHVVNNRPDSELGGLMGRAGLRPELEAAGSEAMEDAARALGLTYRYAPVEPGQFPQAAVEALDEAMADAQAAGGRVLAYCRSGTRSVMAWALHEARKGELSDEAILEAAAKAGYDMGSLAPMLRAMREGAGR